MTGDDSRRPLTRRPEGRRLECVQVRKVPRHFFGYWWGGPPVNTHAVPTRRLYPAGTVPVACPFRRDAAGTHGEQRHRPRSDPGQRLRRSVAARIRRLPNLCSLPTPGMRVWALSMNRHVSPGDFETPSTSGEHGASEAATVVVHPSGAEGNRPRPQPDNLPQPTTARSWPNAHCLRATRTGLLHPTVALLLMSAPPEPGCHARAHRTSPTQARARELLDRHSVLAHRADQPPNWSELRPNAGQYDRYAAQVASRRQIPHGHPS